MMIDASGRERTEAIKPADREQTYVELQFCPSPELIPIVRRFVSSFYERLHGQAEVASRLALATQELLENTVKFAVDGVSSIHVGMARRPTETVVSIRTRNRSTEHDSSLASEIIDEMSAAPDAFERYQAIMQRNARRGEGSGLGLARVCAEAEMNLSCEIDENGISVMARAVVPGPPIVPPPSLPYVSSPNFTAVSAFDGGALSVRLTGVADGDARGAIESLLPRVHAEALRTLAPEVVVDFTELEFMNSSCFRCFVSWLGEVQDLSAEQQYHVLFVSNPNVLWQRRSLHALRCFAHDLVRIES